MLSLNLRYWLFLLFCLPFGLSQATSQTAIPLGADQSRIELQAVADYLQDPAHNLILDDIRTGHPDFKPAAERGNLSFGYVDGAVWLRLPVYSVANTPMTWRLELDYASLDKVYFAALGEELEEQRAGDQIPYAQRSLSHRNPVFEFNLDPGQSLTLYLQVTTEGSMTLNGNLIPRDHFEQRSQVGYLVHALYLGILIALGAYNLLLFMVLGERPFLNYVLFLLSCFFVITSLNGLGAQYLWTEATPWSSKILPLSLCFAATFAIAFARGFLGTQTLLPLWDRLLLALFYLTLVTAAAGTVLPSQMALQLATYVGSCTTVLLSITGCIAVARKIPGSSIFALAWIILLVGSSIMALRNFALIPSNTFSLHAMQASSALEMILLALALAARFNKLKRQREEILRQNERTLAARIAERTEELEQANLRLQQLALTDPLTALANRAALQQHLALAISRSLRQQDQLAVMLIDLDGFKPINDQFGHEVGDQVLIIIAQRLQKSLREADLAARLGGDEFVAVCENVGTPEQLEQLALRILEALRQPIELNGHHLSVSASIGIALHRLQDNATSLMRRADHAMYQAKGQGRNQLCFAEPQVALAN